MSLPKIAYVMGQYPLVSLTFIQREIAALRALGLDVITCSMRQTPAEHHQGAAEKDAVATTYYVLEKLRRPMVLLGAQKLMFRNPKRYLTALKLAWKMRSPGLKSIFYQLVYFIEATLLARHFEETKASHIHAHFTTGATTAAMLTSELTGIPYSFTLHGPADFLEPYRWKIGEKAARAEFVATISHYARSQLMFFTHADHWDRLKIIHCGVELARYDGGNPGQGTKEEGTR
ncbi:MAG: glycosyltransferase, partial [Boseongicola sp.]